MKRADELEALRRVIEPPEPHQRTREEWLWQAERDAAAGDWVLAAVAAERAGDPRRARDAWTKVVGQGPAVGWPTLAAALARLGRRAETKAAWSREARLRTSKGDWLEAALAHGMASEIEAEKAAWASLAVAATQRGEHALAYLAWEMAGESLQAAEAARSEASKSVKCYHQATRESDPARALDSADWWEAAGLPGRAKSARDSVSLANPPFGPSADCR